MMITRFCLTYRCAINCCNHLYTFLRRDWEDRQKVIDEKNKTKKTFYRPFLDKNEKHGHVEKNHYAKREKQYANRESRYAIDLFIL